MACVPPLRISYLHNVHAFLHIGAPDGKATVAIDAAAKASKSKNTGIVNLYLGASGTGSAGVPNTAHGEVLINADSKGVNVNIPLAKGVLQSQP